jgi:hypothetical protein
MQLFAIARHRGYDSLIPVIEFFVYQYKFRELRRFFRTVGKNYDGIGMKSTTYQSSEAN